jgi:hypothetical protein
MCQWSFPFYCFVSMIWLQELSDNNQINGGAYRKKGILGWALGSLLWCILCRVLGQNHCDCDHLPTGTLLILTQVHPCMPTLVSRCTNISNQMPLDLAQINSRRTKSKANIYCGEGSIPKEEFSFYPAPGICLEWRIWSWSVLLKRCPRSRGSVQLKMLKAIELIKKDDLKSLSCIGLLVHFNFNPNSTPYLFMMHKAQTPSGAHGIQAYSVTPSIILYTYCKTRWRQNCAAS